MKLEESWELDRAVAEEVMGWATKESALGLFADTGDGIRCVGKHGLLNEFKPSQDPKDAIEALTLIADLGFAININVPPKLSGYDGGEHPWLITAVGADDCVRGIAEAETETWGQTFGEAACKACLKVVRAIGGR